MIYSVSDKMFVKIVHVFAATCIIKESFLYNFSAVTLCNRLNMAENEHYGTLLGSKLGHLSRHK